MARPIKVGSSAHRTTGTRAAREVRFVLDQVRACRECHGHGLVWIDGTPDLCPKCDGSGERW